jgi:hypothetical protein
VCMCAGGERERERDGKCAAKHFPKPVKKRDKNVQDALSMSRIRHDAHGMFRMFEEIHAQEK